MGARRTKLLPLVALFLLAGLLLGGGLVSAQTYSQTNAAATATVYEIPQPQGATQVPAEPTSAAVRDAGINYKVTGGMTISGRLTDPSGMGIPGVPVDARPASPGANAAPAPCVTDANGNYAIIVDAPGLFRVFFLGGETISGAWSSSWYGDQASEIDAETVPVGASGVDAVLLPTGVLRGRVEFPTSGPFPVDVIAYRADLRQNLGESGTDPLTSQPGDFSFTSLPPGDYKLLFIPAIPRGQAGSGDMGPFWYGGADWNGATVVHIGVGQRTEIKVSFPQRKEGSVFGTLSYDREAYPSAAVALVDERDTQRVVAGDSGPANRTYVHGFSYFQMSNVPAGRYKLRCALPDGRVVWYLEGSFEGTEDFSQATTIEVGQSQAVVGKLSFGAMSLPATISGQVTRPDGTAVASRPVYAVRISEGKERIVNSFYPLTDGSGRYSGSLSPGRYKICTTDWSSLKQYCLEPVDVGERQAVTNGSITMPQNTPSHATIMGKVLAKDGKAAWKVEVVLTDRNGSPIQICSTDPKGGYRFDVPAGDYRIFVKGSATNYSDPREIHLQDGDVLSDVAIRGN